MKLIKYTIHHKRLSKVASFIWHLTSDDSMKGGRLLPVLNTDLIINLAAPIYYHGTQAPKVHVRNVKQSPQFIHQEAPIDVWGVSLLPYGLYLLMQEDMSQRKEQVIDIHKSCEMLLFQLEEGAGSTVIAEFFSQWLPGEINESEIDLLQNYLDHMLASSIGTFCKETGINIKYLERLLKRYTGFTPKQIQQIGRFQQAGNQAIYQEESPSLVDLTYAHNYSDQMHMTKHFQQYAGTTPFLLLNSQDSIKKQLRKK